MSFKCDLHYFADKYSIDFNKYITVQLLHSTICESLIQRVR